MLHKFFGVQRLKPSWRRQVPPTSAPAAAAVEERPSALKIINAGGNVESYYMAVPATRIMEKYPSSVLARPDVFRRPWDAVVRPEEILVPGQKFFIVPRRTLKKLRQRMHKPGGEQSTTNSSVSESFSDVSAEIIVSRQKDDFFSNPFSQKSDISISSIVTYKTKGKTRARNRHVRFLGVDTKQDSDSFCTEKKGNAEDNPKKSLDNPQPGRRGKRRVRNPVTWQPTLTAIREIHCSDE